MEAPTKHNSQKNKKLYLQELKKTKTKKKSLSPLTFAKVSEHERRGHRLMRLCSWRHTKTFGNQRFPCTRRRLFHNPPVRKTEHKATKIRHVSILHSTQPIKTKARAWKQEFTSPVRYCPGIVLLFTS